jgi:DNA repair exonuclease SbcCD ATPase subunit
VKIREASVKQIQANISHYKVERKQMRSELYDTYKVNTRKYKEMEERRVDSVMQIEDELKQLRSAVAEMELKLTTVRAQNVPSDDDFEALKHLRSRLRTLQREAH